MSAPKTFDPTMELACTLSPTPISLRQYAGDCGEATLHGFAARLKPLVRMGMGVVVDRRQGTAWVVSSAWNEFEKRCLEYWRRVYGE